MDGFNRRPQPIRQEPVTVGAEVIETPPHQPVEQATSDIHIKEPKGKKKTILYACIGFMIVLIAIIASGALWYSAQLAAVGTDKGQLLQVTIQSGATPSEIADLLKENGLIRNKDAFAIYTRLTGTQNKLQAGGYRLSPAETTPEIVKHLTDGNVDTFRITFLPGATLAQHRDVLINAGYSEKEVEVGLSLSYDSPLFTGKPAGADLEGFIYGETYDFSTSATVEDILGRTFLQYEKIIDENDLVSKFAAQGLSLYEGIILASIIQREAVGGDESKIAQVFLSRLAIGEQLGADATYQYIADKLGQPRDLNFDSPYNTRRFAGIPPGPIASPGLDALIGVANPADTDYLFFVHGDDNVAYFSRSLEEHEANVRAHCIVKCSTL